MTQRATVCQAQVRAEFKMPTLEVNNFNIVLSVLGGWLSLFGLVSYLCKEHFYLSEACELRPDPILDASRLVQYRAARHCVSRSLLRLGEIRGRPLRLTHPQTSDIALGGRGILASCE